MEKQKEIIKLSIEAILSRIGVSGDVEILDSTECPQFIIRTNEAGILIGENGNHLIALSHVVGKIIDREFKKADLERVQFLLDVNDYRAKKIEELKNVARMSAQRAMYFKKEIEMEPMNAYERKIIHTFLAEYPDIMTESTGQDPERRILIKLYGQE